MAYLQLPNGKYLRIPEGMSPDQAYDAALTKFPNLLDEPQQKKGIGAALGKGTESVLGSLRTGAEALISPEEAAKKGLQRSQELSEKYAEQVGLDPLKKAYEERGVLGAGGELMRQVPLAIAEQAPNLATMFAGAKLGARAPIPGVYGKAIGAGIGAIAPSLLQQFGTNVERQAIEQKEAGQPIDISRGKALAAAVPQAGLDVAASFIPLGGKIAGKIFGPEVEQLLMRGGTEAAERLAQESFKKTLGKGVLVGAAAEIPTEITQQMLERAQAGLSLTSADALKEYGEVAYQAGLLAPIGGAGRFIDKSGARGEIAARQKTEEDRLAQESAQQKQEATLNKQAMDEMAKIAAEQKPLAVAPEQIAEMQKEVANQRGTLQRELARLQSEAVKESDIDKLSAISERAAQLQTGLDQIDPDKVKAEINSLGKEAGALNKQIKAAEKKAPETVEELTGQLQQTQSRLEELKAKLPALAPIKQEGAGEDFKKLMAEKLKQIDNAKETGNFAALGKLIGQYKEMQGKYQGIQGSLFEGEGQYTYPDADRAANEKIRAELAAEKEAAYQKALSTAEEATTPQAAEVVQPATKEDIAAQKEQQDKIKALQDSRDTMQSLFDTANSSNDIEAAFQLRKLIDAKDKEIEAAKSSYPKAIADKYVGDRTREEDIALIKKYQEQIKEADDKLKAANPNKIYDAEGNLTKYGESLAAAQKQRDTLAAELPKIQERLDKANIAASEDVKTTTQVEQAFPDKGGPDVEVMGKLNVLRKRIGDKVTARAAMMGLRRKLEQTRAKRNKAGKGVDREEVRNLISQMRDLIEKTTGQEKETNEIPIPANLPENSKKYYTALNQVRAKQDKALETYMDSMEALVNRDYIGGVTKKAKVTKGVLEKRIEDNLAAFANTMLEEVAIHRRVAGAVELTQERKKAFTNQYVQALQDFKRLASGELGAPEAARSVIAEDIGDITYAAINDGMSGRFVGKTQRVEPLIKMQFGQPVPEEVGTLAKDMGLTVREKDEGKKLDVSNVGAIEQRDLFADKELEPVATKRATHANFMRFVGIQANRFKQAQEAAQRAINAAQKSTKSLEERILSYRKTVGNYKKTLDNVLANVKEEARQKAQAEVRAQATKLRKEALAISDQLYGEQLQTLETSLATLKSERDFFAKSVKKMAEGKFKIIVTRKINDMDLQIKSLHNNIASIYESYEAAVENAPVALEEKLYQEYVDTDPVLKSVVANMQRKRATFDKLIEEHNDTLSAEGRARRKKEAVAEEPVKEITAEERAQEQRLLAGLNLSGMRLTGNLVDAKATLAKLNDNLKRYIAEGKKGEVTKTRNAIDEQEKIIAEMATPLLTPEQQVEKRADEVTAQVRKDVEFSTERKALKERQAEMRKKEGIELAQKKRAELQKELVELQVDQENAKTKKLKDSIGVEIAAKEKEIKAVKATPTEAPVPQSKRAKGPATRDITPPKMFDIGTKNNPIKKGKAVGDIKKGITGGAKAFDFDMGVEREITGLSAQDFGDLFTGLGGGFKARDEKTQGAGVSQADVKKELAKVKMPKGLDIIVVDKVSPQLAELIQARGYDPKTIRGAVMASGKVMIVAGNHTDIKDVKSTIAHELIGHVGVDGLLGEAGMKALAKKIQKDENSVFELAKKLGVFDDVFGAYAAARKYMSEEDAVVHAVRELIAHVEEASPNRSFLEKANAFLKAMVGALRSVLRKMGLDLDISTSDIYKLLRDARANFKDMAPGAHVNKMGEIVFRPGPAVANVGFENALNATKGIVAEQANLTDKVKAFFIGFETKYVDRFAPIQTVAKKMTDSLKATQMMYYLRMHDQRMSFVSEITSNGPLDLVKATDGKGFVIRSVKGANLVDMVAALGKARVGNTEATKRVFTLWMIAQRVKTVGLNKLDFSGKVTQELLNEVERNVAADPQTSKAFKEASDIYAEYNAGLINFAVKTGAISKKDAEVMLQNKNFIPFYRQRPNSQEVFLEIGGAPPIKIGNLTDQPYLHELIGGKEAILDIFTSALQNTSMLTDMALRNNATKEVANSLASLGMLKSNPDSPKDNGIHKGEGKLGPNTIRFKVDGEMYSAEVDTKTTDIPSELLVKGLQGVNTSLPRVVEILGGTGSFLRKWITRNPAYALRQLIRDPLNAVFVSGLDTIPVASSIKEIGNMWRGKSEGEMLLRRSGILGGQVLTGTIEDQNKILNDLLSGKKGWDYYMAQLDKLAVQGDAATRVVMYNNFMKQGLSDMEATLATLEAMNFNKRGISPSLFQLSIMVPFMNAQIQGLNVLYKSFRGQMPFAEKLRVKQKLVQRALMMWGFSMIYASLMQDDEAYQNANDDEKYSNWFVPNPFSDEHIKVPIPFEVGLLFKAVPEALVNTIFGDAKAKDAMSAIAKMAWNNVPNIGPAAVKPIVEVATNYSYYTGRDIESARMQQFEPGERYTERTTEIAKSIGGMLNISPTKIEYLIRGYTGSVPLAVASLANPILRDSEGGEKPDSRGIISSETPLIGTFFQPKDASGLINKAYGDMNDVIKVKQTHNKMLEEGRDKEAQAYLDANADMMGMSTMAGQFRQKMGELTKQERTIRAATGISGKEKREALDEIRQSKIELAKEFSSARD
jgi:DNA repair exonuclease SbcCD ATPase subunit